MTVQAKRRKLPLLVKVLAFALLALIASVGTIVLRQDRLIFPGAYSDIKYDPPPNGVEVINFSTRDGQNLEMWRRGGITAALGPKYVGLLLHGNGQNISSFHEIPEWISSLGIPNYSLDYRGFGHSTGKPSEKGLYIDVEDAAAEIMRLEKISSEQLIVVGHSLGAAPALYFASLRPVAAVVLLAPFSSLTQAVAERPYYSYLRGFLWSQFPNEDFITKVKTKCVIDAHGWSDSTISANQSLRLRALAPSGVKFWLYLDQSAEHYDILEKTLSFLTPKLSECLSS